MNVSGVRPYAGFYQYNSIKLNEARNTQIAAAEAVNSQTAPANQNASAQQERPEQTFSSYDFAQQYNPDETFDLKGANSDINMLDVQKAVSNWTRIQCFSSISISWIPIRKMLAAQRFASTKTLVYNLQMKNHRLAGGFCFGFILLINIRLYGYRS